MIFSHEKRYIFLRNPKTGSRSMQRTLIQTAHGANGRGPHMLPHMIVEQLGREAWDQYFKFVFVRHPWDHFVSLWCWFIKNKRVPPNESFIELAFREPHFFFSPIFEPYLTLDGKPCVDFIGKLERIQEDYNEVCNLLSLNRVTVPNVLSNYGRDRDYRVYYNDNPELIARVEYLYGGKEVIDYYGYKYGDKTW